MAECQACRLAFRSVIKVISTVNMACRAYPYFSKSIIVKLPAYEAGHLEKIFAHEGICNPFLAPTLLAFIPVYKKGYSSYNFS